MLPVGSEACSSWKRRAGEDCAILEPASRLHGPRLLAPFPFPSGEDLSRLEMGEESPRSPSFIRWLDLFPPSYWGAI